jgi:2-methylcitrate dehydratase PrpD
LGTTYIEQLSEFASGVSIDRLPPEILEETKRVVIDSIGCALASTDTDAGRIGIDYGRVLGGDGSDCTVLGVRGRSSLHGATFANTELIAALDLAPINPPAHVAPYVLAAALGMGEFKAVPGARILTAVAAGLEVTSRFAHAMDANREVKDGRAELSRVMGFSASIFGTTVATALCSGSSADVLTHALGIAAGTSPVNALRAWQMHVPNTSVKYSLGGGLTVAGLTAYFMAHLGHRGDRQILDDSEYGYRRFIATHRWEPERLADGLGEKWMFPAGTHYKPYPHCRVTHALFDALIEVVRENSIEPSEIESLTAYGEEWATGLPTYMNCEIERPYDGQFSFAHGLSVAAHLVPPGREWQDPKVVYHPSVLDLMSRVVWKPHEGWATAFSHDPAARPSRIEIIARGRTFVAERAYPKGSRSPDQSSEMTTEELSEKFRHNAARALGESPADRALESLLRLEECDSVREVLGQLVPSSSI